MKKPSDVPTHYFKAMMNGVPEGAVLIKSKRPRLRYGERAWWRDFVFQLTKKTNGGKCGDYLIMSCPCKFERRG